MPPNGVTIAPDAFRHEDLRMLGDAAFGDQESGIRDRKSNALAPADGSRTWRAVKDRWGPQGLNSGGWVARGIAVLIPDP